MKKTEMMRVVMVFFFPLAVVAVRRSAACCLDDEFLGNATSAPTASPDRRLGGWDNTPAGSRQREEQCACAEASSRSKLDKVVSALALCLLLSGVVFVFVRSWRKNAAVRSRTAAERSRVARRGDLELETFARRKALIDREAALAKAGLVDLDDDGSACAVCLEGFGDRSPVSGPNCRHAFHRPCLIQWIDTAHHSDKSDTSTRKLRALTCPTCALSLLPLDLEEEEGPQDVSSTQETPTPATSPPEDSRSIFPQRQPEEATTASGVFTPPATT